MAPEPDIRSGDKKVVYVDAVGHATDDPAHAFLLWVLPVLIVIWACIGIALRFM